MPLCLEGVPYHKRDLRQLRTFKGSPREARTGRHTEELCTGICSPKLAGIRDNAKLGTVADTVKRMDRVATLVAERALHDLPRMGESLSTNKRAAHLCKAIWPLRITGGACPPSRLLALTSSSFDL